MTDLREDIDQKLGGLKKVFGKIMEGGKPKTSIGIDVGSRSLKIIELGRKGDHLVLKNYAYVRTDKKLIKVGTEGVIENVVSGLLKRTMEEMKMKPKGVNVAIPSFASLVTVFDVSAMAGREIEQVIRMEAPKYIPVRMSDVVYGWQIINTKNESEQQGVADNLKKKRSLEPERLRVLVVAIMKEISQRYEKVFAKANMSINSLEIDSFSLIRSLVGNDEGCYLLLDVGHKVSNLIIVDQKSILVNRTIDVAGERITAVLEKGVGINSERAEQLKFEQGIKAGMQNNESLLSPTLGIISSESRKTVEVFKKEYPNTEIEKVILSGGGSRMIGLKDYIQDELGIETIIGNSLSKIKYPKKLEKVLMNYSPFLSIAVGLAMLGFEEEALSTKRK